MKIPLITWSGGVDSTSNVINMFASQTPFETVYVMLPNNKAQQKRELAARKRIIKRLTEVYGNWHVKDNVVDYVCSILSTGALLPQVYVWATSISYNLDLSKYSRILFGYIRGDDFWHVRSEFEVFLKASHRLLGRTSVMCKCEYPLEWQPKSMVMETYYKDVKDVLKLTSWCESPKAKPCGKCKKCMDMKS